MPGPTFRLHDRGGGEGPPDRSLAQVTMNTMTTDSHSTAVDPVCGMTVDPADAAGSVTVAGTT